MTKTLEDVVLDLRYNYLLNKLTSTSDHEKIRAVCNELIARGCSKEMVVKVLESVVDK